MLDKIIQIKLHRMTPAERFTYEIFTNLVEYYHPNYPNNKYYKYNDELLFNHNLNNGYFWCHHTKFWRILEWEMELNYNQIQVLIKKMIKEHLKKDGLRPESGSGVMKLVEKTLIKKEIEPLMGTTEHKIENELIKKIHPHTTDNVCTPIQEIQPHGTNNVETYTKITEQLIKK